MGNVIVGVTSWKMRIDDAYPTLKSILEQTRKPDIVELNLDTENFPNRMNDLPKEILWLSKMHPELHIDFADKDIKVWAKIVPTMRRHLGEDYTLVTIDDDNLYPPTYIEEVKRNIEGCDWLCSQHDVYTMGQFMAYSSKLLNRMSEYLTDQLITETLLDDHTIFHVAQKLNAVRGHSIESDVHDRCLGYSFRRMFMDSNPVTLRKGDYPFDAFVKERKVLEKYGIV